MLRFCTRRDDFRIARSPMTAMLDQRDQPKEARHCEGRRPVAISCAIVQSRTVYQEIAPQAFPSVTTAFGLAMTW